VTPQLVRLVHMNEATMAFVRDARADDFPKVHPLLLDLPNARLVSQDQWRQLFVDHWGFQDGKFGYVLQHGDEVVGFISTIYSERVVRSERLRFCCISNWIVKEQHRADSLALLSKILALKSVEITNLTPSPPLLEMFQKLKYKVFDRTERVVFASPTPALARPCTILTDPDAISAVAGDGVRQFVRDHRLPYNRHVLIRSVEGDCYVMFDRSYKAVSGSTRLPFARVHHVSNARVFARHAARLVLKVMATSRVVGMIIEERMLRGETISHSIERPGKLQGSFRSNKLTADDVDNLYAEHVLLNY
jgi:hypothetical protein